MNREEKLIIIHAAKELNQFHREIIEVIKANPFLFEILNEKLTMLNRPIKDLADLATNKNQSLERTTN